MMLVNNSFQTMAPQAIPAPGAAVPKTYSLLEAWPRNSSSPSFQKDAKVAAIKGAWISFE